MAAPDEIVELTLRLPASHINIQNAQAVPAFGDGEAWLLTVERAAELCSISPSEVRKRVYQNDIPSVKVGKLLRIKADGLAQWIASLESGDRTTDNTS